VLIRHGETESRNGRLDAAVNTPAETSSSSSVTPSVWKEYISVLMRSRVWLAYGGRGIAGGEREIVKAVKMRRAVRPQKRGAFRFGGLIQR
jgi:hypothetical protein